MITKEEAPRKVWQTPTIVDLDGGTLDKVENGFLPGTDGAGGFATSMS